ncbi:hypothetical protein CLOM_g5211 [Closterium sp. NIES-68]|nr:hypothetical protein CLOM_g5211 [Closterium sp. NIES-68]GJP63731.1 hypothetical protein CLOP_g20783 [Closterium sp. NIES-67]
MSYAAYKVVHPPTGVTCCASGFLTRSATAEPLPNLIVSRGNVLEVFSVRSNAVGGEAEEGGRKGEAGGDGGSSKVAGSNVLPGATLDVVCEFRLNGVVESMAVVPGAAATDAPGWVGTGGGGPNSGSGAGRGAGRGGAGGEGGGRGGRGRGGRQMGKRDARGGGEVGGGGAIAGDLSAMQGAIGSGSGNSSGSGSGSSYSGRKDALVLTFREAKVSVVEFDDATQRLKVSSLHFLEGPEWAARKRGRENFPLPPIARSDWSGRCSAVLVYRCHLHFLTRKQAGHNQTGHNQTGHNQAADTEAAAAALASPTALRSSSFSKSGSDRASLDRPSSFKGGLDRSSSFRGGSAGQAPRFGGSFTIDLRPLGISNVRDFVFLSEPGDPIVAVLWEEGNTWAGRLGGSSPSVLEARFSCAVTFLRVSLHTRSHLILGTTKHLPFDSYALSPAPFPPGGLLVLSPHSLHFCSASSTCHLALNDSSPPALPDGTEIPRPRQQPGQGPLSVELDAAHATWQPVIGPSGGSVGVGGRVSGGSSSSNSSSSGAVVFLASKGGALVVVKVTPEPKSPTFSLDLLQVRATVQASGIISLGPSLLFVASRLGDSMLIRYRANELGLEQRGPKRLRAEETATAAGVSAAASSAAAVGAGEEELATASPATPGGPASQEGFSFRVCDSLLNIGPIRGLVPIPALPSATPQQQQEGKQQQQMLVACSGHGKNGALSVLLQRVPLDVLTQEDLPGCCGLWTVYGSALPGGENGQAAVGEAGEKTGGGEGAGKEGGGVEGGGEGEGVGGRKGSGEVGSGAGAMEVDGGSGAAGAKEKSGGIGSGVDGSDGGDGGEGGEGEGKAGGGDYHGFLVLAFESQSMVLETGELLREVSAEVSFITDAPTLLAANLFSRRCILQVTPSAVRLLASSAILLQEMLPRGMVVGGEKGGGEGMEEGPEGVEDVEIESADVADPYVMLRLVDGRFVLLGPDPSKPLSLIPIPCHLPSPPSDPITAYSLLLCPSSHCSKTSSPTAVTTTTTSSALACALGNTIKGIPTSTTTPASLSPPALSPTPTLPPPLPPSLPLCAVARRSGLLQLYLLPSLRCVYSSLGLADSHTLLKHTPAAAAAAAAIVTAAAAAAAGGGGKESARATAGAEAAAAAGTAAAERAPAAVLDAMEVDVKPEEAQKEGVGEQGSGRPVVEGEEERGVKEERKEGEGKEGEGKEEVKGSDVDMEGGSGAGSGRDTEGVKAEEGRVKTETKEPVASHKSENDAAGTAGRAGRETTAHTPPAPVAPSPFAPDWPKLFVVDLHVSVNPATGRLFLFVLLSDGRLLGFRAFCPSGASPADVIAASVTVSGEGSVRAGGRAGGGGGRGDGEGEKGAKPGSVGVAGLTAGLGVAGSGVGGSGVGGSGVGGSGVAGLGVGGLRFQRVCLEEEEAGIHQVDVEGGVEEEGKGERGEGREAVAGDGGGGGGDSRVKQEGGETGGGDTGGEERGGGDHAAEEKEQGEEGKERSRRAGRLRSRMLFPFQGVGLEGSGGGGGGGAAGRGKGGGGAGIGGVFVAGSRPRWLMVLRDRVWMHPVVTEGPSSVLAMAPFHNINCTHGFLLISSQGALSICQLPPLFQFDNAWPLNKIPLRSTPHSVTLSPDAAHLLLVTSTPVSRAVSQFLVPSLEDSKDPSATALGPAGPGGPGAPGTTGTGSEKDTEPVAMVEDFQLRVVACPSLEAPSRALEVRQSFGFQPFEAVTMVKSVVLRNRSSGQLQTLLAVCTTFITGEDTPGKGRILLFEYNPLATADGDAGGGAAAAAEAEGKAADGSSGIPLLRELYSKEPIAGSSQRGSVAALTALQGNLLLAVGRQLVLYAWNGAELEGIAFLDAPLYVVSMATVKSFVILGDVLKSIYFLHWREEGAQLTLLARDFSSLPITAVDFLIDGSALGLLAADTAKNLQVFAYSKSIETHMGQKLLLKASFHTGEVISKVLRLPLPAPLVMAAAAAGGGGGGVWGLPRNPAGGASGRTNRFGVLAGTLGGAIAVVTPVPELVFRRLDTVQRYMVTAVEQVAGLHPLAYRAVQGVGRGQSQSGVERLIDSQLLTQYALMEDNQQQQLAEDIGSTRPMVLQNLRELAHNALLF